MAKNTPGRKNNPFSSKPYRQPNKTFKDEGGFINQPPEEYSVETFKCSPLLSEKLNAFSQKYDVSKSSFIRDAIVMRFALLESFEPDIRHAVISDFLKNSTKAKK
ncbi:MAG: hypothetical protein ACHQYP_05995 [Nitrospiria bacterium]